MQLILMRHAKSDWHSGAGTDFDRPLNRRGARDAPRMGRWLAGQDLIPEKIVSSPALRARQTVLALAGELDYDPDRIVWEPGIYEASLTDLLGVIRREAAGCDRLLLVGHNPGLDTLVRYLAETARQYIREGKLMTTAAVAVLEIPGTVFDEHCAALSLIKRPRELKD